MATSWQYNGNGHLIAMSHPDRGTWSYTPNSLGELITQTDAKNQTMNMSYDPLGRMLTRQDVVENQTTTWTWGTESQLHEIGRLCTASGAGYQEAYAYDSKGRLAQTTITAESTNYLIDYGYHASTGLPESLTYPESTSGYRLKLRYEYSYGLLDRVSDFNAPSTIFWRLNTMDARGNALDETLGTASPAIGVISSYDPLTGLLDYRSAGTGSPYTNRQDLGFEWDLNGNLTKRIDYNQNDLTEEFFYDALNRLDHSKRNGVQNLALSYHANGNIAERSEGGTSYLYQYHPSRPHAVHKVLYNCACTCLEDNYAYDANGNMTSRAGSSMSWTSYDLPNTLNNGTFSSQFFYTPGRARWKQVATYQGVTETTIYIGGILEKVSRGSVTEYRHYIPAGSSSMAIYTRRSSGSPATSTYYITRDHLGSATAVMDADGASLVNLSFAAFGSRRGAAWHDWPLPADYDQITATTRRGYTGHEHLDNLSLIHMNGRVQDPKLGRFISADPLLGDLDHPQSLNPYSYVGNNPLNATDPTGLYAMQDAFFASTVDLIANGALLDLDNALNNYQRSFSQWLSGCQAALAFCNGADVPMPTAVTAAAHGAVRASTAVMQMINNDLTTREQQREAALNLWYQQVDAEWKAAQIARENQRVAAFWSGNDAQFFALGGFKESRSFGEAVGRGAQILGGDIFAFAFGNTAGKLMTLVTDIGKVGNAISTLNPIKVTASVLSLGVNAVFPNYGFYNGRGYGRAQFGLDGSPAPLNRLDRAGFWHDRDYLHGQWVRDAWSTSTPGLPTGPIGLIYQTLGTPFFSLGGALFD